MDPICAGVKGHVDAVVDYQRDALRVADFYKHAGLFDERCIRQRFLPQLDQCNAPAYCPLYHVGYPARPGQASIGHQI